LTAHVSEITHTHTHTHRQTAGVRTGTTQQVCVHQTPQSSHFPDWAAFDELVINAAHASEQQTPVCW